MVHHKANFYNLRSPSMVQRAVLAGVGGVCVALAWWLLLGGGLVVVGGWLDLPWKSGDPARRVLLASALSIYYIRVLFTTFVFLQRGLPWREVFTIAPWILCIYLLLSISGGTNAEALGVVSWIGALLFVDGSWINSSAEYARHMWKRRRENRGQLYTEGLFKRTRHPNYLGDLVSFSGLCFISGVWATAIIPLLMLAGFLFVNIPILDAHLHDHYGSQFDEYAKRTWKLVPFLY
jgi:protein-S-isoprenylcysteine O-methyltransferase Ste14